MKIQNKALIHALGAAASMSVHLLSLTLDFRVAYYDPIIDPAYLNDGKRRIYIFWHEYIQYFIYLRKHCQLAMLLSRHRDADILEDVARMLGFESVRGSSNRGGVEALREMMRKEENDRLHLTITPDGPRGPRRILAPGCIFLASRLQIPLVAMGVGYDRPFRFKSWDRYAVPRLGSRVRCIPSSDLSIPPDLDKEGIEYFRQKVETILNGLSDEAEEWAVSGRTYENESSVLPGPNHSCMYFSKPRAAGVVP